MTSLVAGRYRLGPLLGAGGMAEVYRADDTRLNRAVAVKLLQEGFAHDDSFRRRFESEARTAAGLSHPNIVSVYDVGEDDDGRPYIVMALIEGPSLAERLRAGPLPEGQAVAVTLDVLAALQVAHTAGVLHRDVKPANILLAPDGSARLADFGIAKALDAATTDPGFTTTNLVVGTPLYLAPERAQGQPATVATDVWSAGVVLYECVAGRHPFPGDTPLAIALAAQRGTLIPLVEARPDVTPELAAVAERALAVAPAERFPSAAAMAGEVRAASARATAVEPTVAWSPEGAASTVALEAATARLDPAPAWGGAAVGGAGVAAAAGGLAAGLERAGAWLTAPRHRLLSGLAAAALALLLVVAFWPGGHGHSPPAVVTRPTTTTSTSTTTTAPVATVSCSDLQSQLQALTQSGAGGGPGPGKHGHDHGPGGGPPSPAVTAEVNALNQEIQQNCGPGSTGAPAPTAPAPTAPAGGGQGDGG